MTFDLEAITQSGLTINLLSGVAGLIPRPVGHQLADFAAARIAPRRSSRLVKAVRSNQWVVSGEKGAGHVLEGAVRETLRHSARAIFDLYHFIWNLKAVGDMIVLEPEVAKLVRRAELDARGLLVAGVHLSGFDLVLRWICQQGIRPLVLTVPNPRDGRRTEFEMRRQVGMNLIPATIPGLRQALKHLEQGGAVLTGIDRPIPRPRVLPHFFGHPAALPAHHIYLAARARVPLVVIAVTLETDGKFHVSASDPIEMVGDYSREADILQNAETVLRVAEAFIRRAPQQWTVPLPVWPSILDQVPD